MESAFGQVWQAAVRMRSQVLRAAGRAVVEETDAPRRLTIVQYGDYADAYRRFERGEGATYYAQKYTVDFVGRLAADRRRIESVTVLCFAADLPEEVLPNGVRTAGVALYPKEGRPRYDALVQAVARTSPTHLVVAAPIVPVLEWGIRARIPMLPLFADSFRGSGLRTGLRNRQLAWVLNHPAVERVANHNLAAAMDLARIGVDGEKIVPFDWPVIVSPLDYAPKEAPPPDAPWRLVYVGWLGETKGVGDAIEAVAELKRLGRDARLTLIGQGERAQLEALAARRGVGDRVTFAGRQTHDRVLEAMRSHDAVLVPSRHEYPEGLPMTLYEALCTRTPLIASDHPMFALRIRHGENALVCKAASPESLAARVEELFSQPGLYTRLSRAATNAAEGYLCPLKWDRLLEDFLEPGPRASLRNHALGAGPFR